MKTWRFRLFYDVRQTDIWQKKARHGKKERIRIEKGGFKGQNGLIKTALVYPNTYQAGMSSLGFQTVYGLINDLEHALAERIFLPEDSRSTPLSVESGTPLSQFDILFFSVSFENDYLNLVSMLKCFRHPPAIL